MYHVIDEVTREYITDSNGERIVLSRNSIIAYQELKDSLGVGNLRRLVFEAVPEYDLARHIATYGGGRNESD